MNQRTAQEDECKTRRKTVLDISFKRVSRAQLAEKVNHKNTKPSSYVPSQFLLAPSSLISVIP